MKRPIVGRLQVLLGGAVNRQQVTGFHGRLLQGNAVVLDRGQFADSLEYGLIRRERRDRATFQRTGVGPKRRQHQGAQNHRGEGRCEVRGLLQGEFLTFHGRLPRPFFRTSGIASKRNHPEVIARSFYRDQPSPRISRSRPIPSTSEPWPEARPIDASLPESDVPSSLSDYPAPGLQSRDSRCLSPIGGRPGNGCVTAIGTHSANDTTWRRSW